MTPLSGFLLGIGLMMLTNGVLFWLGWSWLTNPATSGHLLLGIFGSLCRRCRGIVVLDAEGQEREVRWDDLETSVERATRRIRDRDNDFYDFL